MQPQKRRFGLLGGLRTHPATTATKDAIMNDAAEASVLSRSPNSQNAKLRGAMAAAGAMIGRSVNVFERLRHFVVNTAVLFCVLAGGFAFYRLAARTSLVVKDISVPAALQEHGVTGNVVAQQILDHISEIDAAAGSKKQKAEISGFDIQSTMPSLNLPVGGFNLAPVVSELRQLLGYTETVITGEMVLEGSKDSPKYGLRLRIAGQGPLFKSDEPEEDIQLLISLAAETIMHKFDPINLGYYYYRRKDYEKADEAADAALMGGSSENFPWAYTMHGLIARDQGKLAAAEEDFRQVIELDPHFAMGYVNLSGMLRLEGNLDEAEATARKAIALAPKQQDGYTALAVVLMDKGKRDQALAEMQQGVAANPKDPQSHMALGALQHRLEQYEAAISSFKTSAKLAPAAAPLIGAAHASLQLKRQDDAYAFLRLATNTEPKNFEVWMAYGAAALQNNDKRRAQRAFEKALTLAPNVSAPLIQLSNIFIGEKQFAAAETMFAKFARNFSHDAEFLIGWSRLLAEEGKKAEADAKLQEAQAAAQSNAAALENVARDFESRGDVPEAIAAYEKVVEADPKMSEVVAPAIEKLKAQLAAKKAAVDPAPTGAKRAAARR
jgi:tetratricopeptide (TPR) repeat protein